MRMMDLVADTRRMAYGSMADQLNFLAAEALEGAGELTMVMDVDNITPGMVLSSGLNVYYVISVEPPARKVAVYASYDNSLSQALPVGSPVMIRPRVTDWLLFQNVNDIIRALSSATYGLYREASWVDKTDTTWNTYEIPPEAANMTGLIRVSVKIPSSGDVWVEIPRNSIQYQPEHGVIRLTSYWLTSGDIKFDYKAPFTTAVSLTDDVVVDCGLAETMTDIPPLGAAARLLRTTESRRNQIHNQGDSRRAGEVSVTGNTRAAEEMMKDFDSRVNDEYARMLVRNPWKQSL